jgi:hypothetical protein
VATIEVAAHLYCQTGAGAASWLLVELEQHAIEADRVVLADLTDLLLEEDLVQIDAVELHEGTRGIRGQLGELLVVSG